MWLLMFFESVCFFFFKQKTAYEMRISDWSSDVCSSDLRTGTAGRLGCHTVLAVKGGACVHARGLQPSATLDRCAAACGAGAGQSRPVPEHAHVVFFLRFSAVCSRPASSLPAGDRGPDPRGRAVRGRPARSEEHTSELQSLMRISSAVFCL